MANDQFLWPCDGWATATIKYAEGIEHTYGTADISNRHWTKVVASRGGTVTEALLDPAFAYSWKVVIDHESTYQTMYAHLVEQPVVKVGQVVAAGQTIGYMGRTGSASQPHVHWGIFVGGITAIPGLESPGLKLGDWVRGGKFVPGTFAPLAATTETTDKCAVMITTRQDAYTTADAGGTVAGTLDPGTVLTKDDSSLGFYRVFAFAANVWVPISSLVPLVRGNDGRIAALGSGPLGASPNGSIYRPRDTAGLNVRMRTIAATPTYAFSRTSSAHLWTIPADTFVTVYEVAPDGWSRIMDPKAPTVNGLEVIPGQYTWVAPGTLAPTETFRATITKDGVVVRDAPSMSGAALYTHNLSSPPGAFGDRYTVLTVLGQSNGWYQVSHGFAGVGWVPGWQTAGMK